MYNILCGTPYSSWERGTNENTNGFIRRNFPKGTDFNLIDEKQLLRLEHKFNNKHRKIIGYKTPKQVLGFELKNVA
ncbi:hypothetical protein VP395_15545 [Mariniflexile soesokkakense]|uniref:Integrase catalytic domain-containing protein n=1 Tax=Mariniflexile soesokkakense TaxID=1343160 RepID=A0ABV0AGW5_9FLAO